MFIQIAGTLAARIQANLITLQSHHATNPEQAAKQAEALNANAHKVLDSFIDRMRRFLRIAANFEVSELLGYAQDELAKFDNS
jgi:hypothetical protein